MARRETKFGGAVRRNAQDAETYAFPLAANAWGEIIYPSLKDVTRVCKGMLPWEPENTKATPVKGHRVRCKLACASPNTAELAIGKA